VAGCHYKRQAQKSRLLVVGYPAREDKMGLRRAVLEKVFCVKTTNGAFSDADIVTFSAATKITQSPARKGQLLVYTASAAVSKVYLAIAATGTKTAAWLDITP